MVSDLAACVNIVRQVRSIYKWKGKIEDDREHLLLIKSRYSRAEELTTFIRQNHPYEVCEVITVPVSDSLRKLKSQISGSFDSNGSLTTRKRLKWFSSILIEFNDNQKC